MTAAATPGKPTSQAYAYYVLIVLTLTNVLSVADRTVMGLLLQPIKNELHASDTSMSLLTGLAFVLLYGLLGIPIARWADRGNRKNILALGVGLWSLMTSLCGFATNFGTMALARAGVGIGEATGTPTSMSLISDYFAKKSRPKMIAIFNMGQPFSAVLLTPVIGLVASEYGWRMSFILLGVPGIVIGLLTWLTIREPVRGGKDEAPAVPVATPTAMQPATLGQAVRLMGRSRPFMLIFIGTAITALGGSTLGAWGPALAMRAYDLTAAQIGATQAPISALAGILGGIGGGFVTGWMATKLKDERWVVLLPALVNIITIPAGVLYALAPTFPLMILGGIGGSFTIAFRVAPYLALSLEMVPANYRGMAAAATLIASSVVGQALGPLAVGMISDFFTPTVGPVLALRYGMLFAPTMLALGVIPFFMALSDFDKNGLKASSMVKPD
jgi:MFS family permease